VGDGQEQYSHEQRREFQEMLTRFARVISDDYKRYMEPAVMAWQKLRAAEAAIAEYEASNDIDQGKYDALELAQWDAFLEWRAAMVTCISTGVQREE
jgi:hypothetical protein